MTYVKMDIPRGDFPSIGVVENTRSPAKLMLTYSSLIPDASGADAHTEATIVVSFSGVREYQWIEADVSYDPHEQHEADFEFGLIEIETRESKYIKRLSAQNQHLRLRHFRFSEDDWGTLDIIGETILIEIQPS